MLLDKEVNKLIKLQIMKIRNEFNNSINKLEVALLDPKKSTAKKMEILTNAVELEQKTFKGGLSKIH